MNHKTDGDCQERATHGGIPKKEVASQVGHAPVRDSQVGHAPVRDRAQSATRSSRTSGCPTRLSIQHYRDFFLLAHA
jgi:hypothetical protein